MWEDEQKTLLGDYGATGQQPKADVEEQSSASTSRHQRSWTKHDSDMLVGADPSSPGGGFKPLYRSWSTGRPPKSKKSSEQDTAKQRQQPSHQQSQQKNKGEFLYYIIYAIVNVIISLPGLYGYAAVIFNNPEFRDEMNALSKLVIFSSLMHQLGFLLFSSLNFAIGTVQDAGLIFLSSMSNTIANSILDDGGTHDEVVSTTLVLLSLGTAMLGLILILMGHFQLADAVSYLPMPVVGGYLAFIGYFCLEAGVALCISHSIMSPKDWAYLLEGDNWLLALPGVVAGLCMTLVSRKLNNDAALPLLMVLIPALFYVVIYATGIGLEGAREGGWVGDVAPPVPVGDLFTLVDFSKVHWKLILKILPTWSGMIFVVSFASCLDVAAISLDMGEALDTNRELATVGICNFMSGMTFGYTGSYIFSQTIFTYRTGVHSRWIGFFIMLVFGYVVCSPINILQMAPLFFFGSTLIFIGFDLLYEWLIEIRHKIFITEYAIVWATFIAIQIVGIDFGIVLGVLVAIISHVVATAQISSVNRVSKQSRAVWTPSDYKLLHDHGYHPSQPKIVTLEIVGTVFFGSSLRLLENISDEIGLNIREEELSSDTLLRSPHRLRTDTDHKQSIRARTSTVLRRPPRLVVLDLTLVPNLDVSAARGCFLQLAKLCAKRNIIVCAAGANPKVEWMFRSHDVAYDLEEEARIEGQLQAGKENTQCERLLLFLTLFEALEFCENVLIHELTARTLTKKTPSFMRLDQYNEAAENSITTIISHILGLDTEERQLIQVLEDERYHSEVRLRPGEVVFRKNEFPTSFYIVLKGSVAVATTEGDPKKGKVMSGAGPVRQPWRRSPLLDPGIEIGGSLSSIWPIGGVFGYVDYMLERPRVFRAVAAQDGTTVAKFTRSQMHLLRSENPALDAIMQRLLLKAGVMDLANCTCRD